jgi:hypothetical protein
VGDPEHYKQTLIRALGGEGDFGGFTIEKKADATYKVVSAASIIAKVTRDALLRAWVSDHHSSLSGNGGSSNSSSSSSDVQVGSKRPADAVGNGSNKATAKDEEVEDGDDDEKKGATATDLAFGSGYPGDPKCVEW